MEIHHRNWLLKLWSHNLTSASWTPKKASVIQSEPGEQWCGSQSERKGQECQSPGVGQDRRVNSPFLHHSVLVNPQRLEDTHPHWWGWISFIQLTNSNTNLFQKHPHKHKQKINANFQTILDNIEWVTLWSYINVPKLLSTSKKS